MVFRFAVAALVALCGACEIGSSMAGEPKRELAAAVLFVRLPDAQTASSSFAPQAILAAPERLRDGTLARPFSSLREALRLAPSGALLNLDEGIWREAIEITRPVVLMGRGPGRTRIAPPEGARVAVDVHGADHVELYGLSVEGAEIGVRIGGGAGHRLENTELREQSVVALSSEKAGLAVGSCWVRDVAEGQKGHGIELTGGSIEVRRLTMSKAGRRALVLTGARGRLEDLEVSGSLVAAVQAIDGADVQVLRGAFEGQGGAALYAGAARLSVEGAQVRHDEYGIIAARGAELTVVAADVTDYHVAGVALVNSHGTVRHTRIARGGTESGISITMADGTAPVLLVDNQIQDPGTMGVHVTQSSVTARGNTITAARPDREKDMGDAFFAVDSKLVIEDNVMRDNAGSGVATIRSTVQLGGNGFIGNGRAGVLLLDRSRGTAVGNLFQRNLLAGVEVAEQARATLLRNRFDANPRFDIDTGCGKGISGTAELGFGNTFVTPIRQRACAQ